MMADDKDTKPADTPDHKDDTADGADKAAKAPKAAARSGGEAPKAIRLCDGGAVRASAVGFFMASHNRVTIQIGSDTLAVYRTPGDDADAFARARRAAEVLAQKFFGDVYDAMEDEDLKRQIEE